VYHKAVNSGDEILTGTFWDWIVISHVNRNDMEGLLGTIHGGSEYAYSNEGIEEIADANRWEFKEDGSLYHEVRA